MTERTYPEYRDSGVEWVGAIPNHWAVKPLLALADEVLERNSDLREANVLSLSYGRIIEKDTESNDGLLPESFDSYQIINKDDIVLRLTDLQNDKRSLRSAISPFNGIITSAYLGLKPKKIFPDFFAYLLRAYDLTKVFYSMGGGLRQSMKFSDVRRLPIILPPPAEQSAIAAFLDRETGKIDALVAEQERLIALLKEKRQAVISQAVTKGLDPNAPMKPSGVAWLGEVPAHWELRKLATALREPPCYGVLVPDFESDGVPMLRITDVTDGHADRETLTTISLLLSAQYRRTIVQAGDVAISVVGTIGEVIRIDASLAGVNLSRALARLQPADNLSADFLCFLVQSEFFNRFVDLVCVGTAQRVLNMSALASLRIAFPPIEEQVAIAGNLEGALARLSQLTSEAERAIALLKERRAALISAAVTGKIDVRGAVPEAQEAA